MLFRSRTLRYLAIHELLETDGTDRAGPRAAVGPQSSTGTLRSAAARRRVRARLQSADGSHGLLVHRVLRVESTRSLVHHHEITQRQTEYKPSVNNSYPGSVGSAAESQSKDHDDGQHG